MKAIFHPDMDTVEASAVFAALADPTRLAIVLCLAECETEVRCGCFHEFASPSNLTYHFTKLREAGVTRARVEGTSRYISLRRDELGRRFPGLLDAVIEAARRDPNLPRIEVEELIR